MPQTNSGTIYKEWKLHEKNYFCCFDTLLTSAHHSLWCPHYDEGHRRLFCANIVELFCWQIHSSIFRIFPVFAQKKDLNEICFLLNRQFSLMHSTLSFIHNFISIISFFFFLVCAKQKRSWHLLRNCTMITIKRKRAMRARYSFFVISCCVQRQNCILSQQQCASQTWIVTAQWGIEKCKMEINF